MKQIKNKYQNKNAKIRKCRTSKQNWIVFKSGDWANFHEANLHDKPLMNQ